MAAKNKTAAQYAQDAHDCYAQAEALLAAGSNLDAHEMFVRAGAAASIATMLRIGAPKAPRQRAPKRS